MKGLIKDNHIPTNSYELRVIGMPPLVFTKVSGLEQTVDTVDLPDRTRASGGTVKAGTFTADHPMHHTVEFQALEKWLTSAKEPVQPGYKKAGTLVFKNNEGKATRTATITGMFPQAFKTPDLDMKGEPEEADAQWTFSFDDLKFR